MAECLLKHTFPGNVRELENMIAGAVLHENENTLTLESVRGLAGFSGREIPEDEFLTLDEMEKQYIIKILKMTGNKETFDIFG